MPYSDYQITFVDIFKINVCKPNIQNILSAIFVLCLTMLPTS